MSNNLKFKDLNFTIYDVNFKKTSLSKYNLLIIKNNRCIGTLNLKNERLKYIETINDVKNYEIVKKESPKKNSQKA